MILVPKYQNQIQLVGSLSIILADESGKIKKEMYVPNTVVNKGKEFIAQAMNQAAGTLMRYMAIGTTTDATAVAVAETALKLEVSGGSYARQDTTRTVTTSSITYAATFGTGVPNSTIAVTEAGIFDALSTGNMLCRTVFGTVTKTSTDTLTINWQITVQ
jgi:hypothetical protein